MRLLAGILLMIFSAGCYTQGLSTAPALVPMTAPVTVVPSAAAPEPATAAPPTPTPALPAGFDGTRIHTVQSGETLYQIARFYGVTPEMLAAANAIADPSRILAGQILAIPDGGLVVPTAIIPTLAATIDVPFVSPAAPVVPPSAALPPTLNGVPLEQIIVLPDRARQNIGSIFAAGMALGRNPRAFSKLGDSIIENPHFLARFDGGPYNLGQYAALQPVIDYYAGSFGRQGAAVRRGLHSWSVFDPMFADKSLCYAAETLLACEFRLHNPSLLFVRLGTNDVGVPESFERSLRQVVEFSISSGVIPILATKADRFRDPLDINNGIIRRLALEYNVPLWDFDRIAATLPGRGLTGDGAHLTTFFAHDYTQAEALQRGHGVSNLTALMMLDAIWRATSAG
ncbi:MAG: LysM peptidoglycan-binding domain-containing protein [Chloroflexi bacterium]|nr:LysM peptidoglycan-binding domain-containing protein [Chloroflexota bacterium]